MDFRTDRLGLLLDQHQSSCDIARARLEALTDEEYLWEPTPGCWSIRRRDGANTATAHGAGEWFLDFARPEPQPPPFTTIAWRLSHLYTGFSLRWDWAFGERKKLADAIELTPSPNQALERFWKLMDQWRESLAEMTDEQLDMVGFSQYPYGLDPQLPFIAIVWWTNRELILHTAEIALLRDLWTARREG